MNLQFLTGNEVYWRTRYEPSADASRTAYRTLVSYKETWGNAKIDPTAEWTGTWRDPRFASPANGGGSPENALVGTVYMVNFSDLAMTVRQDEGKLPPVAQHRPRQHDRRVHRRSRRTPSATSPTRTLDNGFRPPGLIRLSTTTGAVPEYLRDFGNTVTAGTTTHHLTLYRAPSGALVFSAGTVQWTWGLDAEHDWRTPTTSPTRACSRRRSTCSPTWAPSRRR